VITVPVFFQVCLFRLRNTASRLSVLIVSAGVLACTVSSSAVAAPVVGTTSSVKGSVYVSTAGAERKAQVRDSIQLNDQVRTRDDSALQILLLDQTVLTVGQNCSLVIDEFIYDPDTSIGSLSAKIVTGAFRYMSGQIGKATPLNARITTPSATVGIRGTFFEGVVGADAVALARLGGIGTSNADQKKASIIVLRGAGGGANTLDRKGVITVTSGGTTISILQPGFAIFSPAPGVSPIGPFRLTQTMRDYLDFFLRSAPNGPGENPFGSDATGSEESGQDQFENDEAGVELDLEDLVAEGIEDSLLELEEDGKGDSICRECK
jgi:hypothetical protein